MPKRPSPFGSATLVDAREIAVFLGCSLKHVRRMAEKGQLPQPVKVGRLYTPRRRSCRRGQSRKPIWPRSQSGCVAA